MNLLSSQLINPTTTSFTGMNIKNNAIIKFFIVYTVPNCELMNKIKRLIKAVLPRFIPKKAPSVITAPNV